MQIHYQLEVTHKQDNRQNLLQNNNYDKILKIQLLDLIHVDQELKQLYHRQQIQV